MFFHSAGTGTSLTPRCLISSMNVPCAALVEALAEFPRKPEPMYPPAMETRITARIARTTLLVLVMVRSLWVAVPGVFGAYAGDHPEELASGSGNLAIREAWGVRPWRCGYLR